MDNFSAVRAWLRFWRMRYRVEMSRDRSWFRRWLWQRLLAQWRRVFPVHAAGETWTNSFGMEFVRIPAGSFMMGAKDDEFGAAADEKPRHRVTISQPFYLGSCLVTMAQWKAVLLNLEASDYPASFISWERAQVFIQRWKEMDGVKSDRLATEAEWEYAARAGSETRFCCGDDVETLRDYAWFGDWPDIQMQAVGRKKPNAWGLYDMHGNINEWVQDGYDATFYARSPEIDPRYDPPHPNSVTDRVLRGGGLFRPDSELRSASRSYSTARHMFHVGFRVARSVEGG
jgi:formylglycine-generating enzyme required for sulfatase activity